jgi:cell division protein FtsW
MTAATTTRRPLPRPPAYVAVVGIVAVLNVIGLVMVLSASSVAALSSYGSSWYFFDRQLIWAVVGFAAFAVAARVDYRKWRRLSMPLMVASAVVLVIVLLPGFGIQVDGARRWLGYGVLRFQPSELAKLAVLVFVADRITARWRELRDWRAVLMPTLCAFGVLAVLVLKEPDLDTTIIMGIIMVAILAVGGLPGRHLATMTGVAIAASAVLSWAVPFRRQRVIALFHPYDTTQAATYQLRQGLIALGSGKWNGVGLGAGKSKWLFLPNPHTDYIFAVIGEELGLIGCLLVVGLFAMFAVVGVRVAMRAPDRFGMLLAVGVVAWVVGQAAVNMLAVVGLIPVSGIVLPFLSAGGSALVFTMVAVGVLANIARQGRAPRPAARAAR